jgi:hypothetical protein
MRNPRESGCTGAGSLTAGGGGGSQTARDGGARETLNPCMPHPGGISNESD